MRIAVFHNLPSGGARRHTCEQVRELARRGCQIFEFTLSTAALDFMPLKEHVAKTTVYDLEWRPLRPVPIPGVGPYVHLWQISRNLKGLHDQSRAIAAEIDVGAFDLVLVKECRFTIAPRVLRHLATPSVFYIHTMPARESYANRGETPHQSSDPLARMVRFSSRLQENKVAHARSVNLGSADRVLAHSYFTREAVLLMNRVETHVLYPGVDLDSFRPYPGEARDPYVLSVGAVHSVKGHGFVIEALGLLPHENRRRLVIASPTPDSEEERRLRRLAESHAVSVEVRSTHDSREMAGLYFEALVLLFASTLEPLDLVSLEAMAWGCYCLGRCWAGIEEVLPEEGIFVTDHDLRQKLLAYAARPREEKKQARWHMRKIAEDKFDERRMVREIVELIEAVADHHES